MSLWGYRLLTISLSVEITMLSLVSEKKACKVRIMEGRFTEEELAIAKSVNL